MYNTYIGPNLSNPVEILHGQCNNSLHSMLANQQTCRRVEKALTEHQRKQDDAHNRYTKAQELPPPHAPVKSIFYKRASWTTAEKTATVNQIGPEPRSY